MAAVAKAPGMLIRAGMGIAHAGTGDSGRRRGDLLWRSACRCLATTLASVAGVGEDAVGAGMQHG